MSEDSKDHTNSFLTERRAKVCVLNKTKKPLGPGMVIHKYSNTHHNVLEFNGLAPNARSAEFEIKYHTGVGTTGYDWWLIGFQQDGRNCYTDPDNLRGFMDWLEAAASSLGAAVVGIVGGMVAGPAGGVALGLAADELIKAICSDEKTEGFKAHSLRSEDENRVTVLEVYDKELKFVSKSGNSTSGITKVRDDKIWSLIKEKSKEDSHQGGGINERTASVVVVNKTGQTITKIAVMHKYSEVHKDTPAIFQQLTNNQSSHDFSVHYHTGGVTTGVDW
jgi:hypothetical protein